MERPNNVLHCDSMTFLWPSGRCRRRDVLPCLAIFTAVLTLAGCDLTQPTQSQSFVLVAVNGQPLPYEEHGGREIGGVTILRALRTDGRVTIFASGRYLWEGTIHYEFDGVERPEFPPFRSHRVGPYIRLSDTLLNLDRIFNARLAPDGERIFLTDRTGMYNRATFEFHRP